VFSCVLVACIYYLDIVEEGFFRVVVLLPGIFVAAAGFEYRTAVLMGCAFGYAMELIPLLFVRTLSPVLVIPLIGFIFAMHSLIAIFIIGAALSS